MTLIPRTLYTQISAVYLLLLLTFCVIIVVFTAREFDAFVEELDQRLNRSLAANLATELKPDLASGLHSPQARRAVERILQINPSLDIYILHTDGRVAASYAKNKMRPGTRIDPEPVHEFFDKAAMLPIRAADPANPQQQKVFSAAPLNLAGVDHVLFVLLQGKSLDTVASMLRNSYILRGIAIMLLAVLLSTLVVGLVLFSLLTRRFRHLTDTVQHIRNGQHHRRVTIDSLDEIGRLGSAVNEMADTIQAQVDALRKTDEERRTLVANLSHDFRTPLTSLRGYTQRLSNGWERLGTAARDECLDTILINTVVLERLATQLASLSRLDANGQALQQEPFSLGELVQDTVLKFQPIALERNIRLETQFPTLTNVCGDIGLIERALSNLIDNALRNTPAGGIVTIHTEKTVRGARLSVIDTGCGITKEELPLVTRRFYRTERNRHGESTGSGLGLAITREILERHESKLNLRSSPGAGTIAEFTLRNAI